MDSPVAFNYLGTYDLVIVVGTKEFQFQMKDCFDHKSFIYELSAKIMHFMGVDNHGNSTIIRVCSK